jgi:endogenous inhibitor of DNA gyrase (YacG/DUF329 family)
MARSCPTCRKPVAPRAVNRGFPFCSERCRLLDLGKWMDGGYRIPGERAGDDADGGASPPPRQQSCRGSTPQEEAAPRAGPADGSPERLH